MDQSARDVQSSWATQTTQRDPEELSDRLNAPSAKHGTAAADTRSGCQPPTSAKPEDPSDARAADSSPRTAIEDNKGKEQGAAEAAATLERLRAQNRRHQANHRARVKRKIEETEYSIANIQHRLNTATERRIELRNLRDHLASSAQQPLNPILPGTPTSAPSNSLIGLSALLGSSTPPGDAAGPASFDSILPAQVTAFTSSFPEELATLASLGSGSLTQPPAQRPRTSSTGDGAHASQAPSSLPKNPFARSGLASSGGSGGGGGNLTGSLLQSSVRHPATSAAVQANALQGSMAHPRIPSMNSPEPQHRGAGQYPAYSNSLVAPHSHPAPISAPTSSLLAGASMHAMENNPMHASSASTGRTGSLWGTTRTHASAGLNLQQLAEPAHGAQSLLSAPVATDATSVGPFTQEEVSEVLSHFRRASEPESHLPGAASLNRSSAYAVPTSSLLHGSNPLLGTGGSAPQHLGGLLSEAGGVPTLDGGGGLDLSGRLAAAQGEQQGIQLPEPISLQHLQALSVPQLDQLPADGEQTPEQMLQALQNLQPPTGAQGGQRYGSAGVHGQWTGKHDRSF